MRNVNPLPLDLCAWENPIAFLITEYLLQLTVLFTPFTDSFLQDEPSPDKFVP
jgi:hypothetical protein